ncbi:uncharacterized protein LOC123013600 [Tribolium madens]|uniref:uncharacterized protein LOC123013600 n=1 Tax=Tribolium madens TaxID=41895 RepID=UPI001CF753B1|nr:uncharacterized protein LOC123013600 [Tribolium madens]
MEETSQRPALSEDEVSQIILRRLKSDKFIIVSFTLDMMGEWIGLCGDHAILNVNIKPGDELKTSETRFTFFVKLYPRVPSIVEFIEGTGAFKKEIFMYKLFALMEDEAIRTLEDCIPRCYLTSEKYIVMENLMKTGYRSLNKHEFFDWDSVKVALEALARLHASSLIYEEKKSCRLIDIYGREFEESYYNDREDFPLKREIGAAITGVLNSIKLFNFPEKLISGKDFRTVLSQVCPRVYDLVKPSKKFRNVVCHGDIWATNVVIKHDEDNKPVKGRLVDFQCARYAPPAQDIMSLIHLTTSREFRKRFMYNLIGIYYTDLEKHVTLGGYDMKKIIPFEEFLASCEEQKLFGMIQAATYFPLILLESQTVKEFFGDEEKNKEALFEDRSILIREYMDKDENYKNRIRDSILDLKDYCDYL